MFARGFPKQADSSNTSRPPVKRRSEESPISPLKKLVIDDQGKSSVEYTSNKSYDAAADVTPTKVKLSNTSDEATADETPQKMADVTPTKRTLSIVIEKLQSPFKKLCLNDKNSTAGTFKVPEVPNANTPAILKGVKILRQEELNTFLENSNHIDRVITIDKVQSDLDNSPDNKSESWYYKNGKNVFIHYTVHDNYSTRSDRIRLQDLRRRGFPVTAPDSEFSWYSWLRFKMEVKKIKNATLQEALADENLFLTVLKAVNLHYQKTPQSAIEEGLEQYKGPQKFDDKNDTSRLHYYGSKGMIKWYRKREMENQMDKMFGTESPLRKLELFRHAPWTEKISSKEFEQLLILTHEALNHDLTRNRTEERLVPYKGPQCHEDRGNKTLMEYNVLYRRKSGTGAEPIKSTSTANTPEVRDPGTSTSSQSPSEAGKEPEENWYNSCNFRVCTRCNKTRILDKRASKCFPLGSYYYAKRNIRPTFHCDMLVDTVCETEEDIVQLQRPDTIPGSWLIADVSNLSFEPTSALLVELNKTKHSNDTNDNPLNLSVLKSFYYKGHKFSAYEPKSSLLVDWTLNAQTSIGEISRTLRFTATQKNLKSYRFTVNEGREAKCCQPWYDPVENSQIRPFKNRHHF